MVIIVRIKEQGMNNMKTFKRILALLTAMIMLVSFAACGDTGSVGETEESTTSYIREEKTKIASLSGAMGMSLAKLTADRDYAYEVTSYADPEQAADQIKNGTADIALLPVNTAATLYNETNGAIKILAINTISTLYVLENGESIKSADDLKGKTVYTVGKGTSAEHIINRVFSDVTVEYKNDFNEITALTDEGKADICILTEPAAASVIASGKGMRRALSISDEWNKICGTPLVQSVVVARNEYIEQKPEYVSTFLMHNELSLNYINANLGAGAETFLFESKYFESAELAAATLPYCNFKFIKGEEMKTAVKAVLDMLNQADPALIGGEVPDDGFYYSESVAAAE